LLTSTFRRHLNEMPKLLEEIAFAAKRVVFSILDLIVYAYAAYKFFLHR
jgi:hypothetical protein